MNNNSQDELPPQPLDRIQDFLDSGLDGVYYLSHASTLVVLSGVKILFDPVLARPPHFGSWLFYPLMHFHESLLEVDYCIVSHQHQDHFDADFLGRLSRNTEILIVEGRPQFEKMLSSNFIKYKTIKSRRLSKLCKDIVFYAVNHPVNGIDSAIAVANKNLSFYHGNDCYLEPYILKVMRQEIGEIDIACIPFAYIHWYPFLVNNMTDDEKVSEEARLVGMYMDFGISQIEALHPKVAIPFGANMFYNDDLTSRHNTSIKNPLDFKNYVDHKSPLLSPIVHPLFAGSIITKNKSSVAIDGGNLSREDLNKGFTEYLPHATRLKNNEQKKYDHIDINCNTKLDFILERLLTNNLSMKRIRHNIYISSDQSKTKIIHISLQDYEVKYVDHISKQVDFHYFLLSEFVYKIYLSGAVKLGEVIASSQFTVTRIPNKYNLEALKYINNVL